MRKNKLLLGVLSTLCLLAVGCFVYHANNVTNAQTQENTQECLAVDDAIDAMRDGSEKQSRYMCLPLKEDLFEPHGIAPALTMDDIQQFIDLAKKKGKQIAVSQEAYDAIKKQEGSAKVLPDIAIYDGDFGDGNLVVR